MDIKSGRQRVLVVEDDAKTSGIVKLYLEKEGYAVLTAEDGLQGLTVARECSPNLIVLDLLLPGLGGLDLCRIIRSESPVPIIMLTARSTEPDKLAGLGLGADDYVSKPFSVRELMARVRAVMRRRAAPADGDPHQKPLAFRHIEMDPARRRVRVSGTPVELTANEFQMLYVLLAQPGIVFTRETLLRRVWKDERHVTVRSVDTLVKRLRRKIDDDPASPAVIATVWGSGYKAVE